MKTTDLDQGLTLARQHPLFESLSNNQFKRLVSGAHLHALDAGQPLFMQNETAERFYLIITGTVRLFRLHTDGREIIINVLKSNEIVGEAAMFFDKPCYPVNANAEQKAQLLSFSNRVYKELLETSSSTCFKVMGALACRLQSSLSEIETLTHQTATQRVVRFILGLIEEHNRDKEQVEITLPIAKRLIAARLAMQPETFSRIIHDFRAQGLLEINGPTLLIARTSVLRALV